MAEKRLITEADVRALPRGGVLRVDRRTIVTPAALDAAHARGLRVSYEDEDGCASRKTARPAGRECLWHGMLANDGTYVVEVRGGRAVVHQLSEQGPVLFGTDSEAEHHG
ncbi:MAG: hypothetical protein H6828_13465 [Planctomycetes bacterium]|nr:hypothetical protein [Planctomycetota bacterium]